MVAAFQGEKQIYNGLLAAAKEVKDITSNAVLKVAAAQEHYFKQNPSLESIFVNTSRELLGDALRKFTYSALTTVQLHSLRNMNDFIAIEPFNDSKLIWDLEAGNEEFICSILFDNALFLWRSFLEFYMKYIRYFCTGINTSNMSTKEFFKKMEKSNDPKTTSVLSYFKEKVFNEKVEFDDKNWGNVLCSFRNRTAHQKVIKPTWEEAWSLGNRTRKQPTVRGKSVANLVQTMFENNAFLMLVNLLPVLYETKWQAGPYREGMYG